MVGAQLTHAHVRTICEAAAARGEREHTSLERMTVRDNLNLKHEVINIIVGSGAVGCKFNL